ncbi:hypothetical protein LWI29_029297 [Acer saccharum]|uniref:PGG domain-containing protein n=1 Tax=Acer saccharum TaxID=4024 RepID=A0AA39RFA6_ACESA|nr:hypothetical protein LWI29_029297 [Acer saccharum]
MAVQQSAKTTVEKLYDAAADGSVSSLHNLLQEDSLVLERVLSGCGETPLHISSMLGHIDFGKEIVNRKVELARVLDSRRSLPLYLAAARGHQQIVEFLLFTYPGGCLLNNIDGRNPVHIAAINGYTNVLKKILEMIPDSAKSLTTNEGTILQLCIKFNQFESFKLLVEHDPASVHVKDIDHNNTILHTAVEHKQVEVIRYLIDTTAIDMNAINLHGFTALDFCTIGRKDETIWGIENSLISVGAKNAKDIVLGSIASHATTASTHMATRGNNATASQATASQAQDDGLREKLEWIEKMSASLMIVASLVATVSFQVFFNPPGGVWQDTKAGFMFTDDPQSPKRAHITGTSIFAFYYPKEYRWFMLFNTTGFMSSCFIILLHVNGLPISSRFLVWILMVVIWISISSMAICYVIAADALYTIDLLLALALYFWFFFCGSSCSCAPNS